MANDFADYNGPRYYKQRIKQMRPSKTRSIRRVVPPEVRRASLLGRLPRVHAGGVILGRADPSYVDRRHIISFVKLLLLLLLLCVVIIIIIITIIIY